MKTEVQKFRSSECRDVACNVFIGVQKFRRRKVEVGSRS
jgi:hypothetical protein